MILKKISFIILTLFVFFGFQSCKNDTIDTARTQLKLIDAPGDYLEVNVEIIDILYNNSENEEDWTSFIPVSGYPINIDLTELIAGNNLLLTDQIIPSGTLKQIRLVLSDNNNLVIEGDEGEEPISVHLDTPSALQSGLKLNLNTNLEPGFSYTFILDWDVNKSIVDTGNSGKYNLKPVIRVNTDVNSGSISGTVTGEVENDDIEEAVPLANVSVSVYQDDIYVAESLTDENGVFLIQGLDAGDYLIKIEQEGYDNYVSAVPITVIAGEVSQIETIEL